MHSVSLISAMAGLILLGVPSAGLAQSAMVDLPKPAGPSKFVSEIGGKPVQIGVPAGGKQVGIPGVVNIVPAPQTEDAPEPLPDPASGEELQDKEPPDNQTPPGQQPGGQAKSSAPDATAACDPDCDDD
jgi:hypothetical protein